MQCRKCGKSIPEFAAKCPYCGRRTAYGWQKEGEKALKPVNELLKKIKR
jgi:hypothetical protein